MYYEIQTGEVLFVVLIAEGQQQQQQKWGEGYLLVYAKYAYWQVETTLNRGELVSVSGCDCILTVKASYFGN